MYSHISYAIAIWGSMLSHIMIEKLFKLQKEYVKLITNQSKHYLTDPLFKTTESTKNTRNYKLVMLVFSDEA